MTTPAAIQAAIESAWQHRLHDPSMLLNLSRQTLADAEKLGYSKGVADSLYHIAFVHNIQSNANEALKNVLRAQEIYIHLGDSEGQIQCKTIFAEIHQQMGSYPRALREAYETVALCDAYNRPDLLASVFNTIGVTYALNEEYEPAAVSRFEQALAFAREYHDQATEVDISNNIGYVYALMGLYEKAMHHCRHALILASELPYTAALCWTYHSLGETYRGMGDMVQALACFDEGAAISQRLNATDYLVQNLRGKGELLYNLGNIHGAIECTRDALRAAHAQPNQRETGLTHKQLSELYAAQNDYAAALKHFQEYHRIQNAHTRLQFDQFLSNMELAHEVQATRIEMQAQRARNRMLEEQLELHEQHIRSLDSYAHTVAHDLKNPISMLMGFAEVLSEELADSANPIVIRALEMMRTGGGKMTLIVDNLLMLASSSQQEYQARPVDMEAVFREARRQVEFLAENNHAVIRQVTALPPALGYESWLEQVWVNYLSNAIKYGGSPPVITVGAEPLNNGCVRFWVRDNGNGIHPHMQNRLFTEFERLAPDGADGSGLGLSIVQRIVSKMDGRVSVSSSGKPGEGTTFDFILPGG